MDFQQAPSREAYLVLDAIANFNNYLEALVTQFSYTTVQPASTSRILEILNDRAAGLLILLTIASVAVPLLGELTIAGASVAATTQAVGAGAGAAAGVQSGILPAVANALPSAHALVNPNAYNVEDVSSFMLQQYVFNAINFLWKQEKTYILAADSSDCGNDQRGPQESYIVLPRDQIPNIGTEYKGVIKEGDLFDKGDEPAREDWGEDGRGVEDAVDTILPEGGAVGLYKLEIRVLCRVNGLREDARN
ncbi:hypothetical protein HO133_008381 [Letharia lupina]|uniref:Uncharacterized protein n=1 Tax=Letharia lupina TaxID=560253 RepID=A0A8H6FG06_9LECA|nr:uncharacterized protein HO133_008381 [Letharia lupina]KAF6226940.1 hypothetical protein HO133_008381 [Letharia lupina]